MPADLMGTPSVFDLKHYVIMGEEAVDGGWASEWDCTSLMTSPLRPETVHELGYRSQDVLLVSVEVMSLKLFIRRNPRSSSRFYNSVVL